MVCHLYVIACTSGRLASVDRARAVGRRVTTPSTVKYHALVGIESSSGALACARGLRVEGTFVALEAKAKCAIACAPGQRGHKYSRHGNLP
jgi:hypothetical protein